VDAIIRADWERTQCQRAIKEGRVSDWHVWDAVRETKAADARREGYRQASRADHARFAYVAHDAEARWLLDRETPGAFAAAKTVNRLAQLDRQQTCDDCDGRGFCQCEKGGDQ